MRLSDTVEGVRFDREETIGCPLCGVENTPSIFTGGYGMTVAIAECAADRIAYQSPRPSIEASRAYMDMRWGSDDEYVSDTAAQAERARAQLAHLTALRGPGRLLDFGAGTGTFASAAAAAGWQVAGVEVSKHARERALQELGIRLDEHPPSGPFDVITLWDVVEHLREPLDVLSDLADRLAPGGWMVLETGNWECWQRLAQGHGWGLYLFDHHFYFSPASLAHLLQRAGLTGGFQLLTANEPKPRIRPSPRWMDQWFRSWRAYHSARRRWPGHCNMGLMVAAVRRPT